jgi:hypothetical protein
MVGRRLLAAKATTRDLYTVVRVWACVAQIDPLAPGLGLAGARREHRHRRVVGMDDAAGHHVCGDQLGKRTQQPAEARSSAVTAMLIAALMR